MSAEKPKIGDVWENDGLILHIDKFSEDKYGKIIYCYDMDKKGYVAGCWYYLDIFLNNAKYLGKSKASVNDLFQTEQDVANNVAKPDLQHLQAENNRLKKVLKNIIKCAPACYNTDECPLKNGDGFDNGCGYNCAYFLAHEALNGESEGK